MLPTVQGEMQLVPPPTWKSSRMDQWRRNAFLGSSAHAEVVPADEGPH